MHRKSRANKLQTELRNQPKRLHSDKYLFELRSNGLESDKDYREIDKGEISDHQRGIFLRTFQMFSDFQIRDNKSISNVVVLMYCIQKFILFK